MNVDIINKQCIFNVNIDSNGNQTVNADIVSKQLIVSVDVFKGGKGDKGDKGEDGTNGINGTDGQDGQDGDNGLSAYQSYLDTTTDNPPLTEQEWSDSFKFTETDPVFQAWINSNPLNGLITLNDIPDATQIVRGFVNIGTQTFGGNKTIVGESSTVGNAFDVKNSSGTELFKVLNNGIVSINGGNTGHKLSINGTLYASSLTVYSSLTSISGNVYLANTKAVQFGSSTTISGIDGASSYINFYLNSLLKFKFSNLGFEILDNIGIILPTPDGLHRYKLSIDNSGLPVTTLFS